MNLRQLKDMFEKTFAAVAFAEQGESDTAIQMMGTSKGKKPGFTGKPTTRVSHGRLHKMPA